MAVNFIRLPVPPLLGVRHEVPVVGGLLAEPLAAVAALPRGLLGVRPEVLLQGGRGAEAARARGAEEGPLARVRAEVGGQVVPLGEAAGAVPGKRGVSSGHWSFVMLATYGHL